MTNKSTKEKIRAVEMEYWRQLTKTEGIRNEEIWSKMNVMSDIITYIEENRLM